VPENRLSALTKVELAIDSMVGAAVPTNAEETAAQAIGRKLICLSRVVLIRRRLHNLFEGGLVQIAEPRCIRQPFAWVDVTVAGNIEKTLARSGVDATTDWQAQHPLHDAVDMPNSDIRIVLL